MEKLYEVINGLGTFYVIADDPTHAEEHLTAILDKADYSFSDKRKVTKIKLLAEEVGEFPEGKPNFSNDWARLIMPDTCFNP